MWVFGFILVALRIQQNNVDASSVLLKNSHTCADVPNPLPASLTTTLIKTFSNKTQLLEVTFNVPFPMDKNTVGNAKIEYNVIGNVWTTVAKYDDKKGLCNFLNTVGREMWFDLKKAIGLTPKVCPIPQGKYHTNQFLLDLTKQKNPAIPSGNYRIKLEVREKSNNLLLLCEIYEIEDKA